jgi:hypothetical protein
MSAGFWMIEIYFFPALKPLRQTLTQVGKKVGFYPQLLTIKQVCSIRTIDLSCNFMSH